MPRVPTIEFPQRRYPSASAPGQVRSPHIPSTLGDTGEGLLAIGEAVKSIGKDIANLLELNDKRQNHVAGIKAKNYIRGREIEFANAIRSDPNYHTYQDTFKKFHQETIKGVFDLVTGGNKRNLSPELTAAINGEAEDSYLQQSFMLAQKEDQMFGSESIAEYQKSTQMAVSYAAQSDDPEYVKKVRKELEDEGQSLVDVNYLNPVKLQDHMEKFDAAVKKERTAIADDSARKLSYDDPEGFLEKAVDPKFLPDLDPGRRIIHQEAAEVRIRTLENLRAKEVNRLQNEKRAELSLKYGQGQLTIQNLNDAIQIDSNTGEPRIDSPFYLNMLERLKSGRDQVTDMGVFYSLYQKPNLRYEDIAAHLDKLNPRHEQMLMAIAHRNTQKELTAAERGEKKSKDATAKVRTRWANQARRGLWKSISSMELSQEDAFEAVELFELAVDNDSIPAQDLPKEAERILEQHKGWFSKWWSNIWSSEPESKAVKPEAPEVVPKAPSKPSPAPVPKTPGQGKGKPPLDFMKNVLPPKEKSK